MANFKLFDPMTMDSSMLPNVAGNYVFLLRKGSHLPKVDIEPKNLDKNTNMVNKEFRTLLSKLRCRPVI